MHVSLMELCLHSDVLHDEHHEDVQGCQAELEDGHLPTGGLH